MTRLKPVTDSGEVVRKEEKRPNLFWPVGIAIALGLVFAGIFSFVLPNLQQSASSGISDTGVSTGNQPQQPVVTAVPVGTETPTPTPTPWQEKSGNAETFKSNEWFKVDPPDLQYPQYQLFDITAYGLKLKIAANYDKILISYDGSTVNHVKDKIVDIRVRFRKDGIILKDEVFGRAIYTLSDKTFLALPKNLPENSEWQPEIIISSKVIPAETNPNLPHKLT